MDIFDLTVPQLVRTLNNVDRWLGHAAAHADADKLLTARLAPDQFAFTRQIQVAADNAKMLAGRLAGKEWPSHPDTETTYEQLKARLASVIGYLETLRPEDYAGAEDRKIKLPWMPDSQFLAAVDYLNQFALPNFYFHVVTAYSILRHAGVPMGKIDFIGPLAIQGG